MTGIIIFLLTCSISVFCQEDSLTCQKLNEEISKYQSYLDEKDMIQNSPEFAGEIDSLFTLISNPPQPKNIKKPLTGKVFISFIVDTLGNTHCFEVSKGINHDYDITALEYLRSLRLKFTSGIISYKGKNIKIPVSMSMPVIYNDESSKQKVK